MGELPEAGPGPEDLTDLRRVLYGLDAILRLHMTHEEELYLALGDVHTDDLDLAEPAGAIAAKSACSRRPASRR